MRITNDEALRASQVGPVTRTTGAASGTAPSAEKTTPGTAPAARVELSAQAQVYAAAKAEASRFVDAVNQTPDTRDVLVAQIKAQVDAGTYKVSGTQVAEQMLRRSQADRVR